MTGRLLAFLGTFLLFVCVAHGNFETTDAGFTMLAGRSLWQRGDSALLTGEEGGDLPGEQAAAAFIKHHELVEKARKSGKIGVNGHAYVWYPMGHVFLLAGAVPIGEAVEQALPTAERRYRERSGEKGLALLEAQPVVVQATISILLPPLLMAWSVLLLFRIARELGANGRNAAITALAIALATQAFSLGREQLSDGPGLALLLATMLAVVRIHTGTGTRWTAAWAGLSAGAAVLLRYQTAVYVMMFFVVIALACRRNRNLRELWLFAAGGAPLLLLFLLTNYLRFGSPLVTGYPEVGDWFQANPLAGLTKILFGAGRGILWFSPMLLLALPIAARPGRPVHLRWLAWGMFATPLLIFMGVNGWQGGQCWAIRYVTPGVVALLAIVLPQTVPWQRWPKTWRALVVAGCLVSLTSVVAPVRGVQQLTFRQVEVDVPDVGDTADLGGWHPAYTPLVHNWSYAFAGGEGAGRWADRDFRHLWWNFWGELYDVSGWLLVLPVFALGALLALLGWRSLADAR